VRVPVLCLIGTIALAGACDDLAPTGLRATPPGTGPAIVFDLTVRPLPEIPFPNDIATFADPTSRTGRRVNPSLVAPSSLERVAREGIGSLEGWGTFAPIFVRFSAPLDLDRIANRMRKDGHRFEDDVVYVINLKTGVPAMLDMGDGNFPAAIRDRDNYYANDPHLDTWTIDFEMHEEGRGLTQSDYRPALDLDFDGVLDHPNTYGSGPVAGVDGMLTWYERETDTLVVRPLLPLEEMTEYAVVLTDRLVGADGQPVRSPFPFIHHPLQRTAIEKVQSVLSQKERANYYGDLAGTGLDHVAFAWSFTTAPVQDDLEVLRDGLFGTGPFAYLANSFPPKATALRTSGLAAHMEDDPPNWQADPKCKNGGKHPFIIRADDLLPQVGPLASALGGGALSQPETDALLESLKYVDYLVVGTYPVTYLMGDPDHEDPAERFQLDYATGKGRIGRDNGHFMLAVPKARGAMKQPFPSVVWSHGTTLSDIEVLIRAGFFARQGLATIGFDAPGHGLVVEPGQATLARGLLWNACAVPWIDAMAPGRARDLDGDDKPDSGGLLWTSYIFHSRENIRQTVLDSIQLTRVLRGFDGRTTTDQDFDGDGNPDLAGDFDSNGVPDVGSDAPIYSSGNSFGGITSSVHGALDPNVAATASISSGGGLTDIASRSYGVVDSVVEQIMTPLFVAVPASDRSKDTTCASTERSVRMIVNDLTHSREIELACLRPDELGSDMTVRVFDSTNGETHCARTGADGRFRVATPASIDDPIEIQIYGKPDVVDSYKTCNLTADASIVRVVRTFERDGAHYRTTTYDTGSPLVAPQTGLGIQRNTPDLRKLLALTQTALESSDPINYARFYGLRPMIAPGGGTLPARGYMVANTVGDGFVVVGTGNALARAAGAVPFLDPTAAARYPEYADWATPPALFTALGGKTPNDVLIENGVIEGNFRLERTPAIGCKRNYAPSMTCTESDAPDKDQCLQTLFDPDWHSEGADRLAAQHPYPPLRLARAVGNVTDAASLDAVWQPRIAGAPFAVDGSWKPAGPLVTLVNAYVNPVGQHVWITANPCKGWDDSAYYDHLLVRFLMTNGSDVYALSHPATHACLATQSCDFLK
jgi:hypothetical protein